MPREVRHARTCCTQASASTRVGKEESATGAGSRLGESRKTSAQGLKASRLQKKRPAMRQGVRVSCNRRFARSIADYSLYQGCCGSLPLLKVSSGCQVAQK